MKTRIPLLLSLGFGLVLVLGLATSLFLLFELRRTVENSRRVEQAVLR